MVDHCGRDVDAPITLRAKRKQRLAPGLLPLLLTAIVGVVTCPTLSTTASAAPSPNPVPTPSIGMRAPSGATEPSTTISDTPPPSVAVPTTATPTASTPTTSPPSTAMPNATHPSASTPTTSTPPSSTSTTSTPTTSPAAVQPASGAARPAPNSGVHLGVRVVVGSGGDPTTADVWADGPTALDVQVQGSAPPSSAAVASPGTSVGELSIQDGMIPGASKVDVLADLGGLSLAGSLGFDWRIVSLPSGSQASLGDAQSAQPTFTPDLPGTYDLTLAVSYLPPSSSNGPTTGAGVTVSGVVDDPPIGAPIETLSNNPSAGIWVDGQPVPDTSDRNGIQVAVLNRSSRELVQYGTAPRNVAGINQLIGIAKQYAGNLAYLMIVSDVAGVPDGPALNALTSLMQTLGHDLNVDERARVISPDPEPFSIIGVPGGASNSAWTNIAFPGDTQRGDITGYLQLNPVTHLYDYVSPDYTTFNTYAPGSGATTNVIQVGSATYAATLPPGATGGLHVLALNPYTLQPVPDPSASIRNNQAWPTNTSAGTSADIRDQSIAGGVLNQLGLGVNPGPIVIVQSIGTVKPLDFGVGIRLQDFGGNAALYNGLALKPGSFALLGRGVFYRDTVRTVPPAAQSLTTLGQSGQLDGVLSRTRSYTYSPLISDSPDAAGGPNTGLISVAYQHPQAFPAFTAPEQAAETYIGKQLNLCRPDVNFCDVRRAYYEDYNAAWQQKALDIARMTYPGQASFTAAEFNAVKNQLGDEVSDLNNVQHYLAQLREPFQRSELRAYVDLQAIGQAIRDAVAPPPVETTSNGLALFAAFVNIAKVFADIAGYKNVKFFFDGVGAGIGLVSALSRRNGSATLDGAIQAKTTELATTILDRFDTTQRELTQIGLLIVSDWGKLETAAGEINTDWRPPANLSVAVDGLRLATQRFYYTTLIPIAYPRLIQITPPPPVGPNNARNLTCLGPTKRFTDEPDVAQDQQIFGFNADGSPISSVVFIRGRNDQINGTPPNAGLLDPLFKLAGPNLSGLGLDKTSFYSAPPLGFSGGAPGNWPTRERAIDINDRSFKQLVCGLKA